jgi:tetratricopeptide (TPR) repeat protein
MQHPPSALRRPPNYIKWGLLGAGIGMILLAVATMLALLLTPVVFRNLSAADQQRVVRRLPFLQSLLPTEAPVTAVLPTIVVAGDPLALLATDTDEPSPVISAASATFTATSVSPSSTPIPPTVTPSVTASLIPPTTQAPLAVAAVNTALPSDTPPPSATPVPPTATPSPLPSDTATASVTASTTATNTAPAVITATPFPTLTPIPPSSTPFPTLTPPPTETPLPTAIAALATGIPTPSNFVAPPAFSLIGKMRWEPQLWNNCGPANLVQVLRFMNWRDNQANVASLIKPTQNDKNVSPFELVNYVNTRTTLRAIQRSAGSLALLKHLVSQQFGVIVETGYIDPEEPDEGWIGHYKTLLAYDDSTQLVTWLDTLKDVQSETYPALEEYWRHFNRVYIVVFPPEREAELMAILGPNADENYNARQTLDLALAEARANPNDAYAWFNIGTSLVMLKQYPDAALAYDKAFSLATLPYRHTWYQFGFYEAYYHTRRFDLVIALADYNIERTKGHEETPFYWRGMALAATGRTAEAITAFEASLAFNWLFTPADDALKQVRAGTFAPPAG